MRILDLKTYFKNCYTNFFKRILWSAKISRDAEILGVYKKRISISKNISKKMRESKNNFKITENIWRKSKRIVFWSFSKNLLKWGITLAINELVRVVFIVESLFEGKNTCVRFHSNGNDSSLPAPPESKASSQDGADGYPLTDTCLARALLPTSSMRSKEGSFNAIL